MFDLLFRGTERDETGAWLVAAGFSPERLDDDSVPVDVIGVDHDPETENAFELLATCGGPADGCSS